MQQLFCLVHARKRLPDVKDFQEEQSKTENKKITNNTVHQRPQKWY